MSTSQTHAFAAQHVQRKIFVTSYLFLYTFSELFLMTQKIRITWVQVMAIIALFGILLGVVGTAWISMLPATPTPAPATTITPTPVPQADSL